MRLQSMILVSAMWSMAAVRGFAATPTGVLSGVVVDENGGAIAGAVVQYRSVPPVTIAADGHRITPPGASSSVQTGPDGKFAANLAPSRYHVCVYGVKTADLGTCEWGPGTTIVDLASGQTSQLSFRIQAGATLTFQVNDANRRIRDLADLPTVDGRIPLYGANFAIGVWAESRYVRATLVANTGTARTYQLVIPKTAAVRLFLDTSLNVNDVAGSAVAIRQPGTVLAPNGQAGITTTVTIP